MSAVALKRQRLSLVIFFVIVVAGVWYASARNDISEWKALQDRTQQQLDQSDRQWKHQMDDSHESQPNHQAK